MFGSSRAFKNSRLFSYHFPILLEAGNFVRGPSPFRFINLWLHNDDCLEGIDHFYKTSKFEGWAGFVISSKLRNLRAVLKTWQADLDKNSKELEHSLLDELNFLNAKAESGGLSSAEIEVRLKIKGEVLNICLIEERNLRQ